MAVSPAHPDALRTVSENKIVVVQIDDRLNGQLAGSPENEAAGREKSFDDSIVGVSALANYLFTQEHPDYEYIFVEPSDGTDGNVLHDVDGHRSLSSYWNKVYALALSMRAMPKARWFLALDTDAFLGVTAANGQLDGYIQVAERANRHVVLQACRTEGETKCTDFWGRELGKITPPVYAEPMAFNSGAVLVRQSAEGRAFINTWIGLTSKSVGPSPLEQRYTTMEVSVGLEGIGNGQASDAWAREIVARAISDARVQGAPLLEEHEQACVAIAPTILKDIEPTKSCPSATMTETLLRFNLRSVTGNAGLQQLANWITADGPTGQFARILRETMGENQLDNPPKVSSLSSRTIQDRSGEFLVKWPGDQERLSWACGQVPQHVCVVPWNDDPFKPCFQYVQNIMRPLLPGNTILDWCAAPVWHACHDRKTKQAAHDWVRSVLAHRYRESELNLRHLPVLKPDWGRTQSDDQRCTLEVLLSGIGKGNYDFYPGKPKRRELRGVWRLRRAARTIRSGKLVSRVIARLLRVRRRLGA